MCEILDQVENRGIQKGIKLMQGENDMLRAEKDALRAEKDAVIAEKDAELARKEAELVQAMELLKKHNIAFA